MNDRTIDMPLEILMWLSGNAEVAAESAVGSESPDPSRRMARARLHAKVEQCRAVEGLLRSYRRCLEVGAS